ncbi:MAG: hypothetical protein ACE5EJ_03670, partial [Nitrosopumilaceae archaeon]
MGSNRDMRNLKVNANFVGNYQKNSPSETFCENSEDFRDSLILQTIELVYGVVGAQAIINHVSQHVGKSRAEILSNYE